MIYFLHRKSDVAKVFQQFHKDVETQLGYNLKSVQTDNGGEFKALATYISHYVISHRFTCPYTSEQNGIVERKGRHIVEMGMTLMKHASLLMQYWFVAFFTTVLFINRLTSKSLSNISHHEKMFLKPPDYNFLRVFDYLCYPLLRPYNKHKLDFRSSPYVFWGYCANQHGFISILIHLDKYIYIYIYSGM